MQSVTKLKDPATEAYIQGHQYVCAILSYRSYVIPWGIRLSPKPEHGAALQRPFHKTAELATQLIRAFHPLLAFRSRCYSLPTLSAAWWRRPVVSSASMRPM
jgi:hypothetical protein